MSSWTRDMAKKVPGSVESMPVFETPEIGNEPKPLLMSFAPASRLVNGPSEKRNPPIFIQPIVTEKPTELLHKFDNPTIPNNKKSAKPEPFVLKSENVMFSFDTPSRLKKKEQPQLKAEPWTPIIKKTTTGAPPALKQLNRPLTPQVTVLIDVKDNVEFTEPLLQSITRQTFTNWVALIGLRSNDEQVRNRIRDSILKLQIDNIVTVVLIPESANLIESYKELHTRVETPYIALAKNTDLWVSKKLEKQFDVLAIDSNLGVVGTMSRLFGEKLELADVPPGQLNATDFITNNPLVFSSVLLKSGLLDFSNDFSNFDYECWIKHIKDDIKMTNISDILTLQRVHSSIVAYKTDDKELIRKKYSI